MQGPFITFHKGKVEVRSGQLLYIVRLQLDGDRQTWARVRKNALESTRLATLCPKPWGKWYYKMWVA